MEFTYYSEWQQLPAQADALFKQSTQESMFASHIWLEHISKFIPEANQALCLACVEHEGALLAMLPMYEHMENRLKSITNHLSSHYVLLTALDSHEHRHYEAMLDCLAQGSLYSCVALKLLVIQKKLRLN